MTRRNLLSMYESYSFKAILTFATIIHILSFTAVLHHCNGETTIVLREASVRIYEASEIRTHTSKERTRKSVIVVIVIKL